MRVLVTGGSGFVGRSLVRTLLTRGDTAVRVSVRQAEATPELIGAETVVGDLATTKDWTHALQGVDTVIHAAARVHVMDDRAVDPLAEYRSVNVDGTLRLAGQAAATGVRRFVFVSSIKVNGEASDGRAFTPEDPPHPQDAYGVSKHEAEQGLRGLAATTGMEVVIVRPPLVYGPGVRANFQSLIRLVARRLPLPLGAIDNRRSFVAIDNLSDFILTCVLHPAAANQTFLVSDGEDISTTDLVRRLARCMGLRPRLVPVPVWLLKAGAILVGRRQVADRLCGSLQVDIGKARRLLGWTPPVSLDEGLRRTVQGFVDEKAV